MKPQLALQPKPRLLPGAKLLSLALVALTAADALAAPCEKAQVTPAQPALPEAWQRALVALVDETGREGQPWSCTGGELSLVLEGGEQGAVLRLRGADGREATRRIPDPGALLSIGEALLAASSPVERSSSPVPAPAPVPVPVPVPSLLPAPPIAPGAPEPRFLLSALGGARYGARPQALWFAATLRGTVPLGDWSTGVWARFALPYVLEDVPSQVPYEFAMTEAGIGIFAGRRLIAKPFELHATFEPSIAVVTMEGNARPIPPMGSEDTRDQQTGAKIDFRLGAGLQGLVRLSERFRLVTALDGELSPANLVKPRRIGPILPPIPTYSIGASLGVGVVLR